MSELAEKVQQDLVEAIDNDDLVLPTLPEVALQIRRAAEDPEISVSTLSKVIGRDTALSARLIKVVNSPCCAPPRKSPTCTPRLPGWGSITAATWPSAWSWSRFSMPARR